MKFRYHRGGLEESLATTIEVYSLDELMTDLKDKLESKTFQISSIRFKDYGYDKRAWGKNYLVLVLNKWDGVESVAGMSDGILKG